MDNAGSTMTPQSPHTRCGTATPNTNSGQDAQMFNDALKQAGERPSRKSNRNLVNPEQLTSALRGPGSRKSAAGPASGRMESDQRVSQEMRELADKMGGQDNYAGPGRDFQDTPFSSNRASQRAFIEKLEKELDYTNLKHKDGTGKGEKWTQSQTDTNLEILSFGLQQLSDQGKLEDGNLSMRDVRSLSLSGAGSPDSSRAARTPSADDTPSPKPADNPRPTAAPSRSGNAPSGNGTAFDKLASGDFGVSQTPGGKQIIRAGDTLPNNSRLHRTGMSGYEDFKDGSHLFTVQSGGRLSGISSSPRSEAKIPMNGGTRGHSFSADYQMIDGENTNIFQMKSGKGGSPNIRISADDEGRLRLHNRDGSPEVIARIKPGEKFNLSVEHNSNNSIDVKVTGENGRVQSANGRRISMDDGPSKDWRFGAYDGDSNKVAVAVSNIKVDNKSVS